MTDKDAPPLHSEKLAVILAARKAGGRGATPQIAAGDRKAEASAAARSASKSKPALRK